MEETLFTKIINGNIPSHAVYQDDATFAFLDIYPVTEGHTLVVPKKQVEFIWDLPEEDYHALMNTVKHLGTHLREVLGVPHVGMLVEGVEVPHAHVHLIPFTHGDEMRRKVDRSQSPNHDALAKVAEKIRST